MAMNTILTALLLKGVLIYLDDIIVMAATLELRLKLIRKVCTSLRNFRLTVKLEKGKVLRKHSL